MSHKRNEALRHVQHSMHHVIAAGEGSDRAPDSCKLCPYYRPDFKFRTLRKYFPRNYTPKQMEDTIIKLLDQWQRKQQRQNER